MKVIGITGRVGSGKSEVLNCLKEKYRCIVIKADEVAHDLQAPGGRCFKEVTSLLGSDCLTENGEIDRIKMATAIFKDPELLKKVNGIVHPAVKDFVLETIDRARKENKCDYIFLEAALLIEAGYKNICDEMWHICVADEVRRDRLKRSRGYSDEKIDSILAKQMSENMFEENCDVSFDNSGDINITMERIDEYLRG